MVDVCNPFFGGRDESLPDLEEDVLCAFIDTVNRANETCFLIVETESGEVSPGIFFALFGFWR